MFVVTRHQETPRTIDPLRTKIPQHLGTRDLIGIEQQEHVVRFRIAQREADGIALNRRALARRALRIATLQLDVTDFLRGPREALAIAIERPLLRRAAVRAIGFDEDECVGEIEVFLQTMLEQIELAVERKAVENAHALFSSSRERSLQVFAR